MRKLDPATFRTMPWKNGGGTTTEVLTLPPGADLETFEARISVARVEANGPFSAFKGIDRTLVVTDGAGMILETLDGAAVALDQESRPFAFTGGDAILATLVDGPVTDFNVMTRRTALRHHASRLTLEEDRTLECSGELTLLLVTAGRVVAKDGASELPLSTGDILTVSPGDPVVFVHVAGEAAPHSTEVLLVHIFRR